jgi:hypothetical protein
MSLLFDMARSSIAYHISNIFREKELDRATSVENFEGSNLKASRPPLYYNLDVIISAGYRVKSDQGVVFRKWATGILCNILLEGYAIDKKRLSAMNKTILIQNAVIGSLSQRAGMDSDDVLSVLTAYEGALRILDGYDHGTIQKPKEAVPSKVAYFSYVEAKEVIKKSSFSSRQDLFGKEKEEGRLEGILGQIRQNVYGKEIYPLVEKRRPIFSISLTRTISSRTGTSGSPRSFSSSS